MFGIGGQSAIDEFKKKLDALGNLLQRIEQAVRVLDSDIADWGKKVDQQKERIEKLETRLEELDPTYQRALQLKTTQEVSFMMDRFEELSQKILARESASKRWSAQKQEQQMQLELLAQMAANVQAAQPPAPAAPVSTPKNGVR